MNYRIIPVTAFSQNCSLIWCEQTRLAALVDPGGDAEKIKQEVDDSGLTLMQILLTHGHLDHVGAAAELAQHYYVDGHLKRPKHISLPTGMISLPDALKNIKTLITQEDYMVMNLAEILKNIGIGEK